MRKRLLLAAAAALIVPAAMPAGFSAHDVPGARIRSRGRISIQNDRSTITAFEFFGDVRQALVTLQSIRSISYHPFGPSVYESQASIKADVPPRIAGFIQEAALENGVDPRLITEIARRESAFDNRSTSRVGARGVMQLMPQTAEFLGVNDPLDERANIFGATRYLKMLLHTFRGDLDLTLAAYNAGPGAVQRYRGVPPYPETVAYVSAIRLNYQRSLLVD